MEKLIELLSNHTVEANGNELLVECLPSIPNKFVPYVTLAFSGWHVKLHSDGTWELKDTGGCLGK